MSSSPLPAAGAEALLEAAAMGRIGVDRRLIQSILESPDASAEVLRFALAPKDKHRIDITPLLVDLLRHFGSSEAVDFYIETIRQEPDEIPDELVEAILPLGAHAIGPLIELYDELGEEEGSEIAFLLASLRPRDPRVLERLIDRLEYDASDGAFCLGVYGDPAARTPLENMLAQIPEEDLDLRREISHALELLNAPETESMPETFDLLAEYPAHKLPAFDVLSDAERIELLSAPDADVRAGAAYSFFNSELNPKVKATLLSMGQSDPDGAVRGRALQALSDAVNEAAIRDVLIAVLNDSSKSVAERGGAAVGLHLVADRDEVRKGLEALYEMGGKARARALEAMWRSLWEPYAKYFPTHLDDTDPDIVRQALRGAGYFRLTRYADKIAGFFDREEPYASLREDALFAYALAMPGETTRGRVRGMLRKIDSLATIDVDELDLVQFALDERLRLSGLEPVFSSKQEEEDEAPPPVAPAAPAQKPGRNDPCPCGSGKKYKKCCGQ
ncbi:MAG: SEC-C metal-binding domain-containing protein [Bryobacteraceae bacterium]